MKKVREAIRAVKRRSIKEKFRPACRLNESHPETDF
jgi:hypothetical protein